MFFKNDYVEDWMSGFQFSAEVLKMRVWDLRRPAPQVSVLIYVIKFSIVQKELR